MALFALLFSSGLDAGAFIATVMMLALSFPGLFSSIYESRIKRWIVDQLNALCLLITEVIINYCFVVLCGLSGGGGAFLLLLVVVVRCCSLQLWSWFGIDIDSHKHYTKIIIAEANPESQAENLLRLIEIRMNEVENVFANRLRIIDNLPRRKICD
jgi:hypothetical protein